MAKQDARTRNQESVGTRFSRRTVTRGIAWTVPVVAVAASAPAFATSCEFELILDQTQSCKKANASSYRLVFKASLTGGCVVPPDCTVVINKVTESTGQATVLFNGPPATQPGTPVIICNANNLSANLIVNATISCDGGVAKNYTVKANQFTSAASTCTGTQFC